jgi:MFS transporter, DHA1 family, inner membrane transport protein
MTSIEQSYATRTVYARLGLLSGGLFVVGTNAFVIAGVLPAIAASLHVTSSQVGYSITFYGLVVAIAAPAVSILLARLSRTTLMAGGLVLIALGTLLAALAGSIETFTAGRVIAALGGAALVPAATAAAPALLPASQRGRALAIAALGFTLATAIGSPLGTALASIGGWRLPLLILAALALMLAGAVALAVREIPLGASVSLRERFAVLRDARILLALVTTLLLTVSFNVVYFFSSEVTHHLTAGSGSLLAILLLLYGVGGVVGTAVTGPVTDRVGSRLTFAVAIGLEIVVFLALPELQHSFAATAFAFLVWGVSGFGAVVPLQHRLVGVDPAVSGISLSWYSTAMYIGIALAPLLGAAALGFGAQVVPLAGAAAAMLALIAALAGYGMSAPRPAVRPATAG